MDRLTGSDRAGGVDKFICRECERKSLGWEMINPTLTRPFVRGGDYGVSPLRRFFSKYRGIGIRRKNAPLPSIPSLKGRGGTRCPLPP